MRCHTCNYSLWRLKTRTCPECGAPFKPSEHMFEPNSVRYRCPGCAQDYYGTDAMGHLVPQEFDCVRCGLRVHMDQMILEPAAGLSDDRPQSANPWTDPRKMGRLTRWLKTVGMTLIRPTELIRATPPGRGGAALWFAVRSNITYSIVGLSAFAIFPFALGLGLGAFAGGTVGGVLTVIFAIIVGLIGTALSLMIILGLWILAAHGILRISGPVAGTIGDTGVCLCYASGANVLSAIPCLGIYSSALSWVWPAVSGAIMLREKQKVSGLRAAMATVIPPLIAAAAMITFFVWVVVWSASMTATTRRTLAPMMAASSIQTAYLSHPDTTSGSFSGNPVDLVADGFLGVEELVPFSGTELLEQDIVGTFSLSDLTPTYALDRTHLDVVAAFKAAVPTDSPVHRLGDVVFIRPPDSAADVFGLWTTVLVPEGGFTDPEDTVMILDGFGSSPNFPSQTFAMKLAQQNRLRVERGLLPIPDPASVPHDQRGWTPPPPIIAPE